MIFFLGLILLFAKSTALAWENHGRLTELALQDISNWPEVRFEKIQYVLPALSVQSAKAPTRLEELIEQLNIKGQKVNWDWKPSSTKNSIPTALNVLVYSVDEPDFGMDQNLNLSLDQKHMGGFKGPASQGFRHMYYRSWLIAEPLVTFHVPLHEMGEAPKRTLLFFRLATQAYKAGHIFWAYRFLGWGLHYLEDIGQPYHSNQFASFKLLPLRVLVGAGWEPFVKETTRIVANYHLSFEKFVERSLSKPESPVHLALTAPRGDPALREKLLAGAQTSVEAGAKFLAISSNRLAPEIVAKQDVLWGQDLWAPQLDLTIGFTTPEGKEKINFSKLEMDGKFKESLDRFYQSTFEALSNTGIAIRWYLDRFKFEVEN